MAGKIFQTNPNPDPEPSGDQPLKRGRGRPRKEPVAEAAPETPKRGRGRPRKEIVETVEEAPKRGRGRPRKEPATEPVAQEEPKRGRGRPRKEPVAEGAAQDQPKRGRPAKAEPAVKAPAAWERERPSDVPRKQEPPKKDSRDLIGRERTDLPGRNRKARQEPPAKPKSPFVFKFDDEDGDLPVPFFREASGRTESAGPRKPGRGRSEGAQAKASAEDRDTKGPMQATEGESRRERSRRRGRDREEMAVESKPQETAAEPTPTFRKPQPAPPVQETREVVRIPQNAPQVVLRDGVPTLVRDGKVYPPILFFGNSLDEKRLQIVLDEIKMAGEAGVEVISHNVDLVVDPDAVDDAVAFAAYLLKRTVDVIPTAQVIFRLVFTAPAGWNEEYPEAHFNLEEGGLGEPSVCDDKFWGVAEECLAEFVSQIRMLPLADNVMGVHLERGEWFFADGWGYDTSRAAQAAFREWARTRYRDDNVALCASWFDGQVQFDTMSVPEFSGEVRSGEEFVRTGRKARRWVDYHLFLSDITVERIGKLAHVAKKASDGYFLTGVSYGYTFEWSHPASGHLGLGKLLRNPEVDFIAGPPSYRSREPGGTSPFPCPIDSFALNGKLYLSEEDFKTPISGKEEPDDFNPVMKTPQALEAVHWRGMGAALAHRSGVCWMDLWGNGWLKTHGIWQRGAIVRKALTHRMAAQPTDPEVAVFIDERSLAYLVDKRAFELLIQNVRESILRAGLSVGFYLLSDLAHREQFPEAKLHVFLNSWDIRPEVRSAIKGRLQRDGKVLFWLYCTGLFDSGRDAMERVREVTGIAIKRQPYASRSGTTLVHRKHPLTEALPEKKLASGSALEPSYFAIPEDGMVLAEYTSTGLPSFVVRKFKPEEGDDANLGEWTSVFLGEPVTTPALFRALGQMAGCHVWSFNDDVVHAQGAFLTVHCSGTGNRIITLPDKARAYNLQTQHWMPSEGAQMRFHATDGSTHSFLVGVQTEIDAILAKPEAETLKIDELPERPENTVRLDDRAFDVQIMRLDTWIDESWSEDFKEDLLLKPSQLDELESFDTAETNGASTQGTRHRGRRRRGKEQGGRDRKPRRESSASDFDISEMNVVFRKRD